MKYELYNKLILTDFINFIKFDKNVNEPYLEDEDCIIRVSVVSDDLIMMDKQKHNIKIIHEIFFSDNDKTICNNKHFIEFLNGYIQTKNGDDL